MDKEIILKQFITKVIKCSYFKRTFGTEESKRVVNLDDVIRLLNFYDMDMNFNILNDYFRELKESEKE